MSIGFAVTPDDSTERVPLMKAADAALYRAELAGRNQIVGRLPLEAVSTNGSKASRRRKAAAS